MQKNTAKLKAIKNINLNANFQLKSKTKLPIPILTAKLNLRNILVLQARLFSILKYKPSSKGPRQSLILKKADATVTAAKRLQVTAKQPNN